VGLLHRESIRSVLGLIATLRDKEPASLGLERIALVPLLDGPGNEVQVFRKAVDTLARLVQEAGPVLVHCRAGWNRSPLVVSGYLMKSLGLGAEEAIARVGARRPIHITPDLRPLLDFLD
jgi:protein-tyrosine phosphatase